MKMIRHVILFTVLGFSIAAACFPERIRADVPADSALQSGTEMADADITEDTAFTASGSPYMVSGDLLVDEDATLTIEAGVTVEFASGATIDVFGTLKAAGTENEHVTFMPLPADPSQTGANPNDDWGLYFEASKAQHASSLSYVDISHADQGVNFDDTNAFADHTMIRDARSGIDISSGTVDLSQVTVSGISGEDAIDVSEGDLNVAGLSMSNVNYAINLFDGSILTGTGVSISAPTYDGIDAYQGSRIDLFQSSMQRLSGGAGIGLYGSSGNITGTTFDTGATSAIQVYGNDRIGHSSLSVRGSTMKNFTQSAVALYDGSSVLRKNEIEGNAIGIDYYAGDLSLKGNDISHSTQAGFVDERFAPSAYQLDLSHNWWGDASGPADSMQDPSGKGDAIMTFAQEPNITPWLTDISQTAPVSSMAFLPGVEASRLYVQQTFENQLWEPNRNADVEKLYLDANGQSADQNVYTRDIIDRANIIPIGVDTPLSPDIYSRFITFMNGLADDGTVSGWKPLPYDWRLGLGDDLDKGQITTSAGIDQNISYITDLPDGQEPYIISQIRQLVSSSDTGKVTMIAHSNGGIVAKSLISKLEKMKDDTGDTLIDHIDRLILVAVPQLGTPESIVSILHGDGLNLLGGLVLNKIVGRQFAINMPTAYNLLPSAGYFAQDQNHNVFYPDVPAVPPITFDPSVFNISALHDDAGQATTTIADYQQFQNFLTGASDGRTDPASSDTQSPEILKAALLSQAVQAHAELDAFTFPKTLSVAQIVGWGLPTVDGVTYLAKQTCTSGILHILHICSPAYAVQHKARFDPYGDGTVLASSADALDVPTYFIDLDQYNRSQSILSENRSHASILEVPQVQQLISNIIGISSSTPDFTYEIVPAYEQAADQIEIESDDGLDLEAYLPTGTHTGKAGKATAASSAADNDPVDVVEQAIPNSSYKVIGDTIYLHLDAGASTTVNIQGTKVGQSDITVTKSVGGKKKTETFGGIPVTNSTMGALVQSQTIDEGMATSSATSSPTDTEDSLVLDVNGDGVEDFSIAPNSAFDPLLYLESMKRIVSTLCVSGSARTEMAGRLDAAIDLLKSGKNADMPAVIEQNVVDEKGADPSVLPDNVTFIMDGLDALLKQFGL